MLGVIQECLLKAQEWSILYKGKGRRLNKRPPWLNNEILGAIKIKKAACRLQKGSQIAIEDDQNLARAGRGAVRKAKVQLELNWPTMSSATRNGSSDL